MTVTVFGQTFTINQSAVPTMTLDHPSVVFSAVDNGAAFTSATGTQLVRLTQVGLGTVTWTAASNQPWLTVMPTSGTGTATLSLSTVFTQGLPLPGTTAGTITLTYSGADAQTGSVSVTLRTSNTSGPPFGSFDSPANGSAGVAGSIAVTGWALDDVQVTRVTLCRDAFGPEVASSNSNCASNAKIYIGDAIFIDGARPDVQGQNPTLPLSSRAGWGYLMLTNFLPGHGNGTYTLYAYAFDADGHTTLLGTKAITCDNADAKAPFGAIDTPGQGAVVSGVVSNFGWVLAPGLARSDPPGGGTVTVYVDGSPIGSPSLWTSRSDITSQFDVSLYAGVNTAVGLYGLDTTTLTNGLHTISWATTDTLAVTSGVGSRFFTVSNGAAVLPADGAQSLTVAAATPDALSAGSVLLGRVGFDVDAPLDFYFPNGDGVVTVTAQELDRIELQVTPGVGGVLQTPQGSRPLPVGSQLDPTAGVFTWAPGAGFVGVYDFVFGSERVRIVIQPKGTRR